jgi:hypothetical protein
MYRVAVYPHNHTFSEQCGAYATKEEAVQIAASMSECRKGTAYVVDDYGISTACFMKGAEIYSHIGHRHNHVV